MEPKPLTVPTPELRGQTYQVIASDPPHEATPGTQTLRNAGAGLATGAHALERLLPNPLDVAELAYRYYCERGCLDGHDLEDWLRAEQELTIRAHLLEPAE